MADRRPRNPAQRLDQAVLAQGIDDRYWPDADLAQFAGHQNLTWWITHLRQAETSIRRLRNRLEALRDGDPPRRCPSCGAPVLRGNRARQAHQPGHAASKSFLGA